MLRLFSEVDRRSAVPSRRRFVSVAAAAAGAGLGSRGLAYETASGGPGPQAAAPRSVLAIGAHYDDLTGYVRPAFPVFTTGALFTGARKPLKT